MVRARGRERKRVLRQAMPVPVRVRRVLRGTRKISHGVWGEGVALRVTVARAPRERVARVARV